MLRLFQLTARAEEWNTLDEKRLIALCEERLRLKSGSVTRCEVVRKGVDARGGHVKITLTVDCSVAGNEQKLLNRLRLKPNECVLLPGTPGDPAPGVEELQMERWTRKSRPVVVGMGPAGLFCALALCLRGARPIVLERGQAVESRAREISRLDSEGVLNPRCNVLFGEGGAGAFSDGKLTCGLNDPLMLSILETFIACGAPQELRIQKKPHIGTDLLRGVIAEMRKKLLSLGAELRFSTTLTDLVIRDGALAAVQIEAEDGGTEEISCEHLFLCMGHSARDTFRMLSRRGVQLERKPFAIGARIEHLRSDIDRAQYGKYAGTLPASEYKLNVHTPDGRGIYTFCMCPGGRVINASHDAFHMNVNGMSLNARDGENSNAALLCGISPEDFGDGDALSGLYLQEQLEAAAFSASGGRLLPICQRVGDFLAERETTAFGRIQPSFLPGVIPGDLRAVLPEFVLRNFAYALPRLSAQLYGFDDPDAVLTAPETRSSSPVRVKRSQTMESSLRGLFPLGEGAGYAGGIMSAALDGLKAGMVLPHGS